MKFLSVFKAFQNLQDYQSVDLSASHLASLGVNVIDNQSLSRYLDEIKIQKKAKVLYGGYLEKRALYNDKSHFQNLNKQRDIHLGIDFWADALTEIQAPISGVVHSFRNNNTRGDYGPTVILFHEFETTTFYSLYGHLSLDSINNLKVGQNIKQGDIFARLGDANVNGGYLPHLHFQLIKDIENLNGDYPGVCHESDLKYYKSNTYNPDLFFKF